jgi:replicative DNA helicase
MSRTALTSKQLSDTYAQLADIKNYLKSGIDFGYESIQDLTGKMRKGQLWTVGGLTGIGKSYFILNIINGISKYKKLNICIFAVEMSTQEYFKRLACMREGIYTSQLYANPDKYVENIKKQIDKLSQDFPEQDRIFEVHGNIFSFEQIEKILGTREIDLIIIDYVQELTVQNKYSEHETMPILAKKIHNLVNKHNAIVVAVSQLNNYATNIDAAKSQSQPFSFGKQLINASDVALQLFRMKKDGVLQKHLIVHASKVRDGIQGITALNINDGYRLSDLDYIERQLIVADYLKSTK